MLPFLRVCGKNAAHNDPASESQQHQQQQQQQKEKEKKKRKTGSQSSKNSLRKVAAQAGRSTSGTGRTRVCTAYCTAGKYDLPSATRLLLAQGYTPDPFLTGLDEQVIHLRLPIPNSIPSAETGYQVENGDVFIFPSGNIVSWSLPPEEVMSVSRVIEPAGDRVYAEGDVETEDLEYVEDSRIRRSRIVGDVIMLGTAGRENWALAEDENYAVSPLSPPPEELPSTPPALPAAALASRTPKDVLTTTLAKVAFSSGLARSTKLAVLESLLDSYLTTTHTIPTLLSRGSKLPFTRSFILRKTGELLEFRAQLNLYSELTDSLPDIFWDSRHELGLEGYYDAVGRALDVDVRIRQLNAKLDYASGIVEVLRERLSERHSLLLEWMIIILITIEVGFEVRRLWGEGRRSEVEAREYREWKERREREEDGEFQRWRRERVVDEE
ncbi:hypothetical protein L873DRAFT_1797437 [Choiromyces venosus 120613-1]|uniref:DUF155 domain-containing protein n=1 Tax=Choiromyces venosus 120613-1 TaxID=1336337 RepID=A0A3N4K5A1_9PEZI|nr:hypothetical protein L873DRAFT_1797437 [Choiromyces venosus 120613-1]